MVFPSSPIPGTDCWSTPRGGLHNVMAALSHMVRISRDCARKMNSPFLTAPSSAHGSNVRVAHSANATWARKTNGRKTRCPASWVADGVTVGTVASVPVGVGVRVVSGVDVSPGARVGV